MKKSLPNATAYKMPQHIQNATAYTKCHSIYKMPQHIQNATAYKKCHSIQNPTAYKMPQHIKCKGLQNVTTYNMPQHIKYPSTAYQMSVYKYQNIPNVIYTMLQH
jgi:hypothetical protein